MCWGLHIMEGDKVVKRIDTTAEAIAFFGIENVRYSGREGPNDPPDPPPPIDPNDADWCLCPIDKDYILERCGYVRIDYDDPRWDSFDTRIEKAS
jgi:hypothetical protein